MLFYFLICHALAVKVTKNLLSATDFLSWSYISVKVSFL